MNSVIMWQCHRPSASGSARSDLHTNPLINQMMNFSFQVVRHYESADRATGDTCGPIRPAVQKGMRLLRQRSMARSVFQVLEGGVPAGTAETDPG